MAQLTYRLVSTVNVTNSSGVSEVLFSGIPDSFTDLVIKASVRNSITNTNYGYMNVAFNGVSTNFSFIRIIGYMAGPDSNGAAENPLFVGGNTGFTGWISNTFSNIEMYIPNYTETQKKHIGYEGIVENNSQSVEKAFQELNNVSWNNTSKITSIRLTPNSGTFVQHSLFSLYGILKTP